MYVFRPGRPPKRGTMFLHGTSQDVDPRAMFSLMGLGHGTDVPFPPPPPSYLYPPPHLFHPISSSAQVSSLIDQAKISRFTFKMSKFQELQYKIDTKTRQLVPKCEFFHL